MLRKGNDRADFFVSLFFVRRKLCEVVKSASSIVKKRERLRIRNWLVTRSYESYVMPDATGNFLELRLAIAL